MDVANSNVHVEDNDHGTNSNVPAEDNDHGAEQSGTAKETFHTCSNQEINKEEQPTDEQLCALLDELENKIPAKRSLLFPTVPPPKRFVDSNVKGTNLMWLDRTSASPIDLYILAKYGGEPMESGNSHRLRFSPMLLAFRRLQLMLNKHSFIVYMILKSTSRTAFTTM